MPDIMELDSEIIFHTKKILLFSNNNEWVKTANVDDAFDVSMGSLNGGSVCDLIGLYLMGTVGGFFPSVIFGI